MGFLSACLCFLLFIFGSLEAKVNEVDSFLEKTLSKVGIVGTQQIKIPGYPNAYNPSIIAYQGGYLLSFRFISRCPETVENKCRTDVSFVGVAKLDKNFKVFEKSVQFLNIESYAPRFSLTAEDARLLSVGNRVYLFFNDLPLIPVPGQFAMYFAELIEERGVFVLKEPAKRLNYSQAIQIEKNWSPFSMGERVYVIYSDQPRVILEVDLNTGICHEASRESVTWKWNLGQIRGGTPAVLVDDQFLTFFHSCFPAKTSKGRAYVMGAYTFDKDLPFTVRRMTPRPLGELSYYTEDNSRKVVFPGGMVIQDHLIHVAWGKSDKQMFITTFNKEKLFSSMKPL